MQIYVGITDYNWFQFLKERKPDEVDFWKPPYFDREEDEVAFKIAEDDTMRMCFLRNK